MKSVGTLADSIKLTNEIVNIKGKETSCFVRRVFCKNSMWFVTISSAGHFTSLIWNKLKVQTAHLRHHRI